MPVFFNIFYIDINIILNEKVAFSIKRGVLPKPRAAELLRPRQR